jgi:hypothetical protein
VIEGCASEEAIQRRATPAERVVTVLAARGETGSDVIDGRSGVVFSLVTGEALAVARSEGTTPVIDVTAFTRYLEV